jgi:hypothetical protein
MLVLIWASLLGASLSVARLRGDWGHPLCGPWGCAPPLQSLVGCHLAWIVALAPCVPLANRFLSPRWQFRLALSLTVLSTLGTLAFLGWRADGWLGRTRGQTTYLPQHLALELASFVDIPFVQSVALGCICLAIAWWRQRV